jgi:TDG/mug DNA glycosylase family protein
MSTLEDLLAPELALVFVGINPSLYAVDRGHYFARKQNRFWPAFSRSRLSLPMRRALGCEQLQPEHDRELPRFGIGLTDVVKRASANVSTLTVADFEFWTPILLERMLEFRPGAVCFQGMVGFRPFVKHGLKLDPSGLQLGRQPFDLAGMPLYCIPNPSPANAHYRLEDMVHWYDFLDAELEAVVSSPEDSGRRVQKRWE